MKTEIAVGTQRYDGKSRKEATGKALGHLAALFPDGEHTWAPVVVRAHAEDGSRADGGENVGVAFKDCNGFWSYCIQWANGVAGSIHSGNWTRQQAEFRVRRHLAQNAYRGGSQVTEADLSTLQVIHPDDKEGAVEHLSWLRFQSSYEKAQASGLDDSAALTTSA